MFKSKKFVIFTSLLALFGILLASLVYIFSNKQDKIAHRLRSIEKFEIGEYHVQELLKPDVTEIIGEDEHLLVKVEAKANMIIDLSKMRSKDIVIDKDSKTISVSIPEPKLDRVSIDKVEIAYKRFLTEKSDEDINKLLENAKIKAKTNFENMRISSDDIASFEKFIGLFVRRTFGEDYNVNVIVSR